MDGIELDLRVGASKGHLTLLIIQRPEQFSAISLKKMHFCKEIYKLLYWF